MVDTAPSEVAVGDDTASDTAFDGDCDNRNSDSDAEAPDAARTTTSEEKEEDDDESYKNEDADEDEESDDDDEEDGNDDETEQTRAKRPPIENLGPMVLEKVTNLTKEGKNEKEILLELKHAPFNRAFDEFPSGRIPTILHWAINYFATIHHTPNQETLNSFKRLQAVALTSNRSLLKIHRKNGETALHLAVLYNQEELVRHLCKWCDDVSIADVMEDTGETCLHMAIRQGMLSAQDLASVAKKDTLEKQRKSPTSPSDKEFPKGNTPLHDALHYTLLRAKSPSCRQEPLCGACSEAQKVNERQCKHVLELIKTMVGTWRDALTTRNADGESPYLFLLSTRKKVRAALHSAGVARDDERSKRPSSTQVSASRKETLGENELKATRNLRPRQGKDSNLNKSKPKGAKSGAKRRKCQALKDDNDYIFNEVEKYVREASFSLGSFEKACECFFGGTVNQGKTSIFWPGHRLQGQSSKFYEFLEYTETMSQVVLSILPDPTTKDDTNADEISQTSADAGALVGVFDLLHSTKSVERILKVKVQDNPQKNCSDETIEKCLIGFDVRYLDWDKYDLCTDVVLAVAENVVELWLYSSGNSAVLRHWSGSDGLIRLKKLQKVHLKVQRGLESDTRNKNNVHYLVNELERRGKLEERKIEVLPDIEENPKARPGPTLNEPSPGDDQEPYASHRWMECVESFVDAVKGKVRNGDITRDRPVKVALIDDGVTPTSDLIGCISPIGWPKDLPYSTSEPFYHSASGHGTEMAKLICRVCPFSQLYVAKLKSWSNKEDRQTKSTAKDAAEAVKWSIDQGVHIISMSWSLRRSEQNDVDIKSLEGQIRRASEKGIIMYCAAEDQSQYGSGDKKVFPGNSDTRAIKTVGSAKEGGSKSKFVNVDQVHYLIPGEEVLPDRKQGGSSAATALAAGLAALILWCFEITPGSGGLTAMANPDRMDELFKWLRGAPEKKWIDVTRLLGNPQSEPKSIVEACTNRVKGIRYKEASSTSIALRRGSIITHPQT